MKSHSLLLLFCLSLLSAGVAAQGRYEPVAGTYTDGNDVYAEPDKMPEFKGGTDGLGIWLSQHVRYPHKALKARAEGKAVVQFVIDEKGRVCDPVIFKSAGHEDLDAEAVRVVRKMPRWKPGMHNGAPVRVRYFIPVNFAL